MKFEMVMPKMGESITEGTILKWLKKEGDVVEKDEIILEISTDKVDSEIPTPVAGKISKLIVQEGDTVDVGLAIAIIDAENGSVSEVKKDEPQQAVPEKETSMEEVSASQLTVTKKDPKPSSNRFYSPVVMNIANENQIPFSELESIPGTGINGRVTKKDIIKYLDSGETATPATTPAVTFKSTKDIQVIEMDHIRKSIAKHMIQSVQTSAHVSLYTEVDMHNIAKIRNRNGETFRKREGFSLTYMAFIAEATVKALKEFPMLNASIEGDKILVKHFINLGIAVAVDSGLIVPNIFNADERNLVGLARAVNDLAYRARTKKLKPDEIGGGTFSISNFGVYGTSLGFPIINQPQVGILGVGAIKKRPVVINDAIGIRPILYLSLTIDHRLIDGAMGAQFLQRIGEFLESYDPDLQI
jgi:2-oxoglutarate dehydrogenase E2 component (dihydrolipoamide succinyltransferase)